MQVYRIDPIKDPRWTELVGQHPKASVFHSLSWLQALRRTYGYETVVFTTSPPHSELRNGIVFCEVNSWLTGRRLVSLPFSDHCEPLYESAEEIDFVVRYLQAALQHENWKYLEIRPVTRSFGDTSSASALAPVKDYLLHILDLRKDAGELLKSFDKDSIQRRIRRAERSELVESCGRSTDLLNDFYRLFVMTRRRHRLPPTPYLWFRHLIECHGDALEIRVAYNNHIPIAAILTLQFRDTGYYKYGCSDARSNKFGAMPWLMWNAIAASKARGATTFDLGRTDPDNRGLVAFKSRWVPQPARLVYWSFPHNRRASAPGPWKLNLAKPVFSCMPNALLKLAGKAIYPHIG